MVFLQRVVQKGKPLCFERAKNTVFSQYFTLARDVQLFPIIKKVGFSQVRNMNKLITKTNTFLTDETGTTSVEYAVMLVLIVGLCITAIAAVGGQNGSIWGSNAAEVTTALQ
ncbi:hypothetical protein MFFC18_11460 [Mariniblastus fucicola]|uniref:Flp/Fap pilin component n=1 Tax=Mariniblastus fucicola TaxID=980251 RepID=A0A5B9PE37_9BACT|nr:hypothetical protein MFFC18_11460 [Mariniblastus fucicola]